MLAEAEEAEKAEAEEVQHVTGEPEARAEAVDVEVGRRSDSQKDCRSDDAGAAQGEGFAVASLCSACKTLFAVCSAVRSGEHA